ncbi:hypothetical protein EHS13_26080 [Paenibacillus psychroresistens]|uniref:Uncharacterized protein n=1 Tax=Paenibacillus psychroresistens TaxID=1778678 RepID=A0A6B8RS95_9BACL|nr:hypothetical protein [Paenibacillus psychroresistens]QGQ98108.1 hypothetical protein EHS13_26080 [Paenibacillus psychroresistens]
MKKTSFKFFAIGLLGIVICLVLAYVLQSAYLLFAACVLPLLILPYMPDIRTNQEINPLSKNKSIQVYGITSGENQASYVVIEFKPGRIIWSKHALYFSADHVAMAPTSSLKSNAIALPIYKSDLIIKKGKHRWVGIKLKGMTERSSKFSFKLKQVNRLVVSIQDIKELFKEASPAHKRSIKKSKQLQA